MRKKIKIKNPKKIKKSQNLQLPRVLDEILVTCVTEDHDHDGPLTPMAGAAAALRSDRDYIGHARRVGGNIHNNKQQQQQQLGQRKSGSHG
jgi:hypothetical protein